VYDNDEGEKVVPLGVAKSKWRDAEESIGSFSNATRAEAVNEKGEVLRVLAFEADAPDGSKKVNHTSGKCPTCGASLSDFAKLLTESNDAAVSRNSEAYTAGFQFLTALLQGLFARNAALEKAWSQAMAQHVSGGAEGDPNQGLVAQILGAALQPVVAGMLTGGGMPGAAQEPAKNGKKP
jgi:hypothetical protein